ncbi:MAG: circularly permuted type 2 ATP-grasp protein [Proteobacteria bacterium]|nr:circularly permuted type 2 ATP-grasp protein [Pseudomonadota bacterium]
MSDQMAMANPLDELLKAYRPPPGGYDEMLAADGSIRPHWRGLMDNFAELSPDMRSQSVDSAVRMLRENDVAYTAWSDRDVRPWRIDLLPLVIPEADWQTLATGLTQRARLMNAIVADLYGKRTLLSSGKLPSALVYGNPDFVVACDGYKAPNDTFLQFIAFDLGRSPDGRWWVLNQLTEAPSGIGYALENRIVTSSCLPEMFSNQNVHRLAGFFRAFGEYLLSLSPERLAVVLSGGPEDFDYFEHAFLSRYLGYPLVEGADLTVRGGRVFLKTLEGLRPVDLILRRLFSQRVDPIEFRGDAAAGVAGLLAAARRGKVVTTNAIGSGVVENGAIQSFLPSLAKHLLGEDLRLPSLASWWCGQPGELAYVREHFDELAIRRAFAPGEGLTANARDYMASTPALASREGFEKMVRQRPYDVVGRERLRLSTIPSWLKKDEAPQPLPMTLRLYVAATTDGYQVMPGGVVKVGRETPSPMDYSKDVWVVADEPVEHVTLLAPLQVGQLKRSDRDLPSKTADDLFWLGRYFERAEGAVRLYRSLMTRMSGEVSSVSDPVELNVLLGLLVNQEVLSQRRARQAFAGQRNTSSELWNMLFDPDSPDGLAKVLENVERTAEHVRERLSQDAWRIIERFTSVSALRWRVHTVANAVGVLTDLLEAQSAVNGLIQENMTRGYGWRLLDLGRRIERAHFSIRVLRGLCVRNDPNAPGVMSLQLELADSAMTYRSRYQTSPELTAVLDLVLSDRTNPRSLIFQLDMLEEHMNLMPLEQPLGRPSKAQQVLLSARADVALAEVEKLASVKSRTGKLTHLDRLLQRTAGNLNQLAEQIASTYFSHAVGHRITGYAQPEPKK